MAFLGVLAVLAGIAILWWTGKNKFERTNASGVQEFSSYGKAMGQTFLENVMRRIAILLILGGGLFAALFWGQ